MSLCLCALTSCSNDDDDNGKVAITAKNVVGTWICYEQKWVEENHVSRYSNESYYIIFNDDYTGEMDSDSDELFEIMGGCSFSWNILDNKICANIYGEELWTIESLTNSQMTLKWTDEGYLTIICKFKKKQDLSN